MKKCLKLFCVGLLIIAGSCADEKIEPLPLTEDLKTSANWYWDQFFSIKVSTDQDDLITFSIGGAEGNISIDWGDGTTEDIILSEYVTLEHRYYSEGAEPVNFAIRMSGDIRNITSFHMYYQSIHIDEMHFGGLTNLRSLDMGIVSHGPRVVNLSKNKLIRTLILGTGRLEDIILPTSNQIRLIDISSGDSLPVSVIDRVIARVHDSVVLSPRTGSFLFLKNWAQEEGDLSMVGPPSSYSLNKLRKLRDQYGWVLLPNIP